MINIILTILFNISISIDQALNCVWKIEGDGFGQPDEMISARAFRCYLQGYISDTPMTIINLLFFWQKVDSGEGVMIRNHCHRAWRAELERSQLPRHYRLD